MNNIIYFLFLMVMMVVYSCDKPEPVVAEDPVVLLPSDLVGTWKCVENGVTIFDITFDEPTYNQLTFKYEGTCNGFWKYTTEDSPTRFYDGSLETSLYTYTGTFTKNTIITIGKTNLNNSSMTIVKVYPDKKTIDVNMKGGNVNTVISMTITKQE